VPRAFEFQLLGIEEKELAQLKKREALVAKELLASLDTNRSSESARFFDLTVKDPLIPAGAGVYLADRLFQRIAGELGSTTRPLSLSSSEFLRHARRHLIDIAEGR
jgi:hypothetical protein